MENRNPQDRSGPTHESATGRPHSENEPISRQELERRLAEERRAMLRQARDDFYERNSIYGKGPKWGLEEETPEEWQREEDYPEPGPGQAYGADYGRLIYGRQRYGQEPYGGHHPYAPHRPLGQDYPAGGTEAGTRRDLGGRFRGRGPKGYVRSDERIREDVCERLSDSPYVDAREIEVYCSQGVVRLEGRVDSRATKRYAEALADACTGVRDVDNRLTIASPDEASSPS